MITLFFIVKSEEEATPPKKPSEAPSIPKTEESKVDKQASKSDQAPPQEAKSNEGNIPKTGST